MKRLLVVLLLLVVCSGGEAQSQPAKKSGPFGFERGMTIEQVTALVGKSAIKSIKNDRVELSTAPKPHSTFETYAVYIAPQKGVVKVVAYSKDIDTSVYGNELKSKFHEVEDAITKAYGTPKNSYDFLRSGSIRTPRVPCITPRTRLENVICDFRFSGFTEP